MSRAWLSLSLLLLAGCSSYDAALVPDHADLATLPRVSGHRIAVLLPEAPAPQAAYTDDDGETPRGALPFDARRLQDEVVTALQRVLPEGDVVAVSGLEAQSAAWEAGYDVVLRARAVRWEGVYLGTNGWWYPNAFFFSWYFFPIGPQWLIADERYGVACEVELTAELAASEKALPTLSARLMTFASPLEPGEVPAGTPIEGCEEGEPRSFECAPPAFDLDDTQRGIDLFGTYDPGDLDAGQWEQVGALLAPFAYRHAALRTAAAVADALPAFDALAPDARREAAATTHALVIGVTDYGVASRTCPGAADDARRLAETLRSPGWAPEKNVLELINANATRERTLAALARLAARTRPDDTLIVTFAGRGSRTQTDESHALVLADGELALSEVLAALHVAPAARRLLVIDADFDSGARGSTLEGLPAANRPLHETLAAALRPEDVVLLASSGDGDAVQTWEDDTGALGGLLSTFVARALAGEADGGGDGLTLGDLSAYLDARVPHVALTLTRPQRPRLVVAGDAGARSGERLR